MKKMFYLIALWLSLLFCFAPASLFGNTAVDVPLTAAPPGLSDESDPLTTDRPDMPLDAWILQPLTGLGTGLLVNAGVMLVGDLLSLLTVHWIVYLPMGISFEEGTYLSSHYTSLASASLLYPLLVTVGVQAYGETGGMRGSGLTTLFSYAGGAVGTALYFLGYREAGVYTMLGAPVAGAMAGFLITRTATDRRPAAPGPSEFKLISNARHLLYNFTGALMGDFIYLATKLQLPVLINDTGDIFYEASFLFRGKPLEWLLFLPAAVSTGVTFTEKAEGRRGAAFITFGATLAASAAGWALSAILESDSTVPAHLLAISASAVTSFILQRER